MLAELGALGACLAFSLGTLYYRSVGVSILTLPGGSFSDPKTLAEPETL